MQDTAAVLSSAMPLFSCPITQRDQDVFLPHVDTAPSSRRMFPLLFPLYASGHDIGRRQLLSGRMSRSSEPAACSRQRSLLLTAKPFSPEEKTRRHNEPSLASSRTLGRVPWIGPWREEWGQEI